MDASPLPNRQHRCYELRLADLFNTGLGYVFPWDAQGKVNLAVLSERVFDIPVGAHIVTPRRWYTHHGIYVGAGQVVHYQGLSSSLRRGPVAKVSLAEFAHGQPVHVHGEADAAYSGIEAAARACSRLGEDTYDVCATTASTSAPGAWPEPLAARKWSACRRIRARWRSRLKYWAASSRR